MTDWYWQARVVGGEYRLDLPHFQAVSPECKVGTRSAHPSDGALQELLRELLVLRPEERITSEAALRHPWLDLSPVTHCTISFFLTGCDYS